MSFVKKTWKDRISQFPNRRTINDGYVTKQVTVGRDEGAVTEEGTPFDATEMNDLENRIYAAIEQGGGGGGGAGTYDYTELFNKPRINNHELNGNKSLGDLGIASNANELPIESGSATTTKGYIDSLIAEKLTDLNTPLTTGTATPKISYYASTASNKPSGNDGVTITQGNGVFRQQMAFDLEGNIYARYYNNGTITSWKNNVEVVNTRLVNARLTWNGSYFTIPSSKPRPYSNQQITVLGRNLSNGAVYAVWYDSSTDGFRMSATLVGNAPSTNNTIDVQYLA